MPYTPPYSCPLGAEPGEFRISKVTSGLKGGQGTATGWRNMLAQQQRYIAHASHMLRRRQTSVDCRGCTPVKNAWLNLHDYAIDLHQQHVKDNALQISYSSLHVCL